MYGSGINDNTTIKSRIDKFALGTLVSLNYEGIKKWSENNNVEYIGTEELKQYFGIDKYFKEWDKVNKSINNILRRRY